MPEHDEPWDVVIGSIVQAHGVQGWLKVLPIADSPKRLQTLEVFRIVLTTGELLTAAIEETRLMGRYALVKLADVDGREAAEALVGATVNIQTSMRKALPPGEYYVDHIIGLRVETVDGVDLGPVQEILETGANDVYVTPRAMIPAVPDAIEEIDVERGLIRVRRSAVLFQR